MNQTKPFSASNRNSFLKEVSDQEFNSITTPPYSMGAEQSVLGGLILDNERWENVADKVSGVDFYDRRHRLIFDRAKELLDQGTPLDLITLSEHLGNRKELDNVGGFAYLAELAKNTPSAANISAYASIVRKQAIIRNLIGVAHDIAKSCYEPNGQSAEELLDLAETKVFQIAEQRGSESQGPQNISTVLDKTLEKIELL
ncbi:MAG: DnaB-like helicase N-terminal domain-containing protein, partial [Enterovibrio sp.]